MCLWFLLSVFILKLRTIKDFTPIFLSLKNRYSVIKIYWRPAKKIWDTLFKHNTTSIYRINFRQISWSVNTGRLKNRFLTWFLNFPSHDPCVNNDIKYGLAGLQNIRAWQQYIVCRGYYFSICQRVICLKRIISYQGSLTCKWEYYITNLEGLFVILENEDRVSQTANICRWTSSDLLYR